MVLILMGKPFSHTGGLYFRQGIFIVLENGDPGPHSPGNMGNRVPILPGEWRPKVPILGGPHFHMTLAGRIGPRSILPVRWGLKILTWATNSILVQTSMEDI